MDRMNIVIVGHVDHGKSTVIGRLLADTGSLPEGKLEQVQATCAKNAKPFEYAFLLDALKDEQSQGITIDAARCFFHTKRREYIVIDAPGHIEFLKNMITGASQAEAALLVIDAKEGILENSKRHGYLLSMLGIRQVAVLVNKMDLVGYSEQVFRAIEKEYGDFLKEFNIRPNAFIPMSALNGVNMIAKSPEMPWYTGLSVLEQLDAFHYESGSEAYPFRFPVQDIYKFTELADDRRIMAGTILTGSIEVGDEVVFFPSKKRTRIKTIEEFNAPSKQEASAGEAIGFTTEPQLYVKPGELMVRASDPAPAVGTRFKANIFWMGHAPLVKGKKYKLKIGTSRPSVRLVEVLNVLDSSELTSIANKAQVDRHDVAECVFETGKPIAFDKAGDLRETGRFVIVDNYEIAGAGIILETLPEDRTILKDHVRHREKIWERSGVGSAERAGIYGHRLAFILISGKVNTGKQKIARELEARLLKQGVKAFYLGISNLVSGLDSELSPGVDPQEEIVRHLGELGRIIAESGQVFITTASDLDDFDIETLRILAAPSEILVIHVGVSTFSGFKPSFLLGENEPLDLAVEKIGAFLKQKEIILEYYL
ncbi:MAG: GTP-binding protein [Candidatus Omnitrophota bacterium]